MLKRIRIESKLSNLRIVENAVDEITSEIGISYSSYGKILISLLEAVNNAIIHGNRSSPEKIVFISIDYRKPRLKIKIQDEGEGFTPDSVPDPTIPENIEEVNGRGVFIIARTPGIVAHVVEEALREKPVRRLSEKDVEYDGSRPRK